MKLVEKTLWEVRYYPPERMALSKRVGSKGRLLEKKRAARAVARLKNAGVEAFASKFVIRVPKGDV